jgi:hypothetical protein
VDVSAALGGSGTFAGGGGSGNPNRLQLIREDHGSGGGGGGRRPQRQPQPTPSNAPSKGSKTSDQWPFNGNLLPLTPQRQDNVCTTGPLSDPMNSDPLILSCCQAHDNCYAAHGCNATSWIPNPLPWGACNTCNLKAASCIKNSLPPIFIP